MSTTYVRWRDDRADRIASEPGRFGALAFDHPSIGMPCEICGRALAPGQVPALVNPRPDDPESWAKALAGDWYNALVDVVHESCARSEIP